MHQAFWKPPESPSTEAKLSHLVVLCSPHCEYYVQYDHLNIGSDEDSLKIMVQKYIGRHIKFQFYSLRAKQKLVDQRCCLYLRGGKFRKYFPQHTVKKKDVEISSY